MAIHTVEYPTDRGICRLTESEVELIIPGLSREYTFVHISDLHITASEDGDSDEDKALAASRAEFWKNQAGLFPIEANEIVAARIREISPDMVFFTGDTMDYPSLSNLRRSKQYLDALGTNYVLAPGNHDNVDENAPKEMRRMFLEMTGGSPQFRVVSLDGLDIVVINDGFVNVTEEQYKLMEDQIRKDGRFCCFCMLPYFLRRQRRPSGTSGDITGW